MDVTCWLQGLAFTIMSPNEALCLGTLSLAWELNETEKAAVTRIPCWHPPLPSTRQNHSLSLVIPWATTSVHGFLWIEQCHNFPYLPMIMGWTPQNSNTWDMQKGLLTVSGLLASFPSGWCIHPSCFLGFLYSFLPFFLSSFVSLTMTP